MKVTLTTLLLLFSPFLWASKEQDKAVDDIFAQWNKPGVPGAALGIIENGQFIYTKGYGMADLEYDMPNDADSVFRIGSTSKQFTAACIVLLAQKGQLKLSDTLDQFFPEFPDYAKQITVRHLLNHTSGIRDYLMLATLKGLGNDDYYQDKDVMNWLLNQTALNFTPGDEFLYSNSGYWLLGQIVNKVAGMNMAEFAEQEIFKPLGMDHTHFHNDHTKIVQKRASGYVPTRNDGFKISMSTLDMVGAGGLFTTINDIKKWDDAFYQSSVLSPAFWQEMTTQGVLNNGDRLNYASGLMLSDYKGLKTIRHGGSYVGFRAELLKFPEQKFTVAIFANRADANPTAMANKVADVFLSGLYQTEKTEDSPVKNNSAIDQKTAKIKLTDDQLVGVYEVHEGTQIKIMLQNEKLHGIQSWNGGEYDLSPSINALNQFQIGQNESLTFSFSNLDNKQANTMTIVQNGEVSTWKRVKESDDSDINLHDLVGDFYSQELDVVYKVRIKDDKLSVQIGSMDPLKLNVVSADRVSYQGGYADFARKDGVVTGFKVMAGRVKNLSFSKQ